MAAEDKARSQAVFAFSCGISSLTSSAAKITAKPSSIRGVTRSPSSRHEKTTPNTDSSESRMEACLFPFPYSFFANFSGPTPQTGHL